MSPIACNKGKVLLWEKCIQAFLDQENTFSKASTCSGEKGGGGTT